MDISRCDMLNFEPIFPGYIVNCIFFEKNMIKILEIQSHLDFFCFLAKIRL